MKITILLTKDKDKKEIIGINTNNEDYKDTSSYLGALFSEKYKNNLLDKVYYEYLIKYTELVGAYSYNYAGDLIINISKAKLGIFDTINGNRFEFPLKFIMQIRESIVNNYQHMQNFSSEEILGKNQIYKYILEIK